MPLLRAALGVVLVILLGGCAAVSRPSISISELQADAVDARVQHALLRDSMLSRLVRRAAAQSDGTLDLLLLSGGGQHGAFGAGFLRGWASRSDSPMPQFDLVSGISTGALQAPFALLGTPAALDTLSALYLAAADRIAPSLDWWFWLRHTGGLVNTSRYERSIASILDDTMRTRLLAEFDRDRQMLLATTDMDLGIGRIWDLEATLRRDPDPLDRARLLFYTATAIPGIFPPRLVDGHVHSDGGIISNILPLLDLQDFRELAARLRAAGVQGNDQGDVQVRVWVIMNVWTHAPLEVIDPSSRRGISARSTEVLFWASQPQALIRLQELARAVSADVPGLSMQVRVAQPAASLALEPGADELFDREWMRRLERLGYDQARSGVPWDSVVSSYQRPVPP